jgi:hypothetical protein
MAMHNIERSGFYKGEHVGYAVGTVWRIVKGGEGYRATAREHYPDSKYPKILTARTLGDMSVKLDGLYKENVAPRKTNPSVTKARKAYEDALKDGIHIDIGSHNTNPAKRKKAASPKRRSQATGKAPTKRLVARRKANVKPGYYPNPIGHGKIAIWLNAGNDANGNPRRLYVVVTTTGVVEGVYDEGYYGRQAVLEPHPGIEIVGQFMITPGQYRELKKQYKVK